MPNGGSDCCGTCWFNRANGGQAGSSNHNREIPSYCEIRQLAIDNPFYTYCANHPYRMQDRFAIPIGPVSVYAGDGWSNERKVWIEAPDTEEIRQSLLSLLADIYDHHAHGGRPIARQSGVPSVMTSEGWQPTGEPAVEYPIGPSLTTTVIAQVAELHERRGLPYLDWLAANVDGSPGAMARDAAVQIRQQS